jgi:hypothetical protein
MIYMYIYIDMDVDIWIWMYIVMWLYVGRVSKRVWIIVYVGNMCL